MTTQESTTPTAQPTAPKAGLATLPPPQTRTALQYRSIEDVIKTAEILFQGGMTPKGVDRWQKIVPMLLTGYEVGLGPAQSMECVTPPRNGRCTIYGDAGLALVYASGKMLAFDEWVAGDGTERTAFCRVQRFGFPEKTFEYTMAQASKLHSFKKSNDDMPWAVDPDNMLKWRARWLALRTMFTDVLKGMVFAEVADDNEPAPVTVNDTTANTPPTQPVNNSTAPPAEMMIEEVQLRHITSLRNSFFTAKAITDESAQDSAWAALLAPFNVTSARSLTKAEAARFIDELTKDYCFPQSSTAESKA